MRDFCRPFTGLDLNSIKIQALRRFAPAPGYLLCASGAAVWLFDTDRARRALLHLSSASYFPNRFYLLASDTINPIVHVNGIADVIWNNCQPVTNAILTR